MVDRKVDGTSQNNNYSPNHKKTRQKTKKEEILACGMSKTQEKTKQHHIPRLSLNFMSKLG
jgi:hypothetical protein